MSLIPKDKKIVVTGGGTGGHTFTSLKFIKLFKRWYPHSRVVFIGSGNDFEKDVFSTFPEVEFRTIKTGKLRRSFDKRNITDMFSFISGIFQAYRFLKKNDVSFLLSTGGYVSLGPVIAAGLLNIPVIIHEQTSVPGLANRIGFLIADIKLYSFYSRHFSKRGFVYSGNPSDISREAFIRSGMKERPGLFISGAANGSAILNDFVIRNIDWLVKNFDVFLQYGTNPINIEKVEKNMEKLKKSGIVLKRFFPREDMIKIFSGIDCMLARAGAGTVSDIIEYKMPAVLVPLKGSAGQEQLMNAKMLSDKEAAILLEEKEISDNKLKQALMNVYINRERISERLNDFEGFDEEKVKEIFDGYITEKVPG